MHIHQLSICWSSSTRLNVNPQPSSVVTYKCKIFTSHIRHATLQNLHQFMHIHNLDDESLFGFEKFMTKMTSTVDYPQKNLKTTHHRNLKTVIHLLSICRSSLGRLNVHTIAYCILRSIKYLLFCHSFINLTAFFLRQRCKTLFLII